MIFCSAHKSVLFSHHQGSFLGQQIGMNAETQSRYYMNRGSKRCVDEIHPLGAMRIIPGEKTKIWK